MKKNLPFRSDIVFLRAASVLAVLFYHFKILPFRSGYVGVDVFFVISGYLMTRIILSGFDKNSFSLAEFYRRRVSRIFPALLTVVLFFAAVVFFLVRIDFFPYVKSAFASTLFFSNVHYYLNLGSGYFGNISKETFLIHTWSLSVEWQFYLLYPLLLLPLRKLYLRKTPLFSWIFAGLVGLSLVSAFFHRAVLRDESFTFYMFYPRAWEMMAGGMAFLFAEKIRFLPLNVRNGLVISCIFVIGICCVFGVFGGSRWFPFPRIVASSVSALATAAIIWCNVDWKIFRLGVTGFLGRVSYSLYLWHWPLWVLCLLLGLAASPYWKVVFILLSVLLATASYHLIEKKRYRNVKPLLALTAVVAIGFFFLGRMSERAVMGSQELIRLAETRHGYLDGENFNEQFLVPTHFLYKSKFKESHAENWGTDSTKKNIIVLGNSHVAMFNRVFRDHYRNSDSVRTIHVSVAGIPPRENAPKTDREEKHLFDYFYRGWFPNNGKHIDLVVISWDYSEQGLLSVMEDIDWIEGFFERHGTPTLYIGQNEVYDQSYPMVRYIDHLFGRTTPPQPACVAMNEILKEKLKEKYIDIMGVEVQRVAPDGTPYMFDDDHLTQYGAEQYFPHIAERLRARLESQKRP